MSKIKINLIKNTIKHNISQIFALTEKNIKLQLRFKLEFILGFINPLISILMPLIIFNAFFNFNQSFVPWTARNYSIFIITSFNLTLLQKIISDYPNMLRQEKFWKTLSALIIAPFNKFDLLLGILLSHLVIISVPFTIFFIIGLILYPINLITIIFVLFDFLLIALIFSGIGLLLGVFAISKPNIWKFLNITLKFIFWASCISYPFALFDKPIQNVISLNPLYYIFTILRMTWVQDNFLLTLIQYPFYFFIIIACAIILPIISVIMFNKVYRKYGIIGY
ncbi:MAG: hypothetical protein ACFFDH_06205 [Promethearchaeota archaeon]